MPKTAVTPPVPLAPDPKLALSLNALALALSVSVVTVKRLVASGALRSFTIGRRRLVTTQALEQFLAEREA